MGYLAFDLGASSGKLFRGNYNGTRLKLETVCRFDNRSIPLGKGLYWDFLNIWKNLCLGIQKASNEGGIRSLGIDTYCNDFSLINKAGEFLLPMRCYRDPRTIRCAEAIYQTMSPKQLYKESGNQTAPFNTLMQLAAMQEEGTGGLLDMAEHLLFLPDLLAYYITGEVLAERTVSSVSQMYNFYTKDWSDKILSAYQIPKKLFGTLTNSGTVSGKTTSQFVEDWGTRNFDFVSVCEHDTASAFLAVPGNGDRAILSSGTWALVGCETAEPVINDFGFRHNIANEGSMQGHHRLVRNVMGSWLLQELRAEYEQHGEDLTFAELISMGEKSTPFAFLIDVDDTVFFSPREIRDKIREKCWSRKGGKPKTGGEFVRCICESLALKYRWAVEKLEGLAGRTLPLVSVIGGGCHDTFTCQMTANACGKPVVAGPADASAIGNILCQLIAHGELRDVAQGRELVQKSVETVLYEPKNTTEWKEMYQIFTEAFGLS